MRRRLTSWYQVVLWCTLLWINRPTLIIVIWWVDLMQVPLRILVASLWSLDLRVWDMVPTYLSINREISLSWRWFLPRNVLTVIIFFKKLLFTFHRIWTCTLKNIAFDNLFIYQIQWFKVWDGRLSIMHWSRLFYNPLYFLWTRWYNLLVVLLKLPKFFSFIN